MKRGNVRVIYGGVAYECELFQIPTDSLDIDTPLKCPHSDHRLHVVGETMNTRKWETRHSLRLLCKHCRSLFLYNYTVSHIELAEGEAKNA